MSTPVKFVDFGAPDSFGSHLFRVEIPTSRLESVCLIENYGYRGLEGGIPRDEERVILSRPVWAGIADIARREFNDRLKVAKVPTARWQSGTNLVDRLLGKNLRPRRSRRDRHGRPAPCHLQQNGPPSARRSAGGSSP